MQKLLPLLLLLACSGADPAKDKQAIIETDKAFSALSAGQGVKVAFLTYAADEVIKPQNGAQPIIGRDALIQSYNDFKGDFILTWEPVKADVSGDIGYTFGNWTRITSTDTLHGNYVSIWKRQSNGAWKFVLDTGNTTE